MSVLDYMGVRGWRCVDTYYISDGKSSRVIHYLLDTTFWRNGYRRTTRNVPD